MRPFLLLPFILLCHPAAADAAPSLAEAIKQADAKYLQAPDVAGKDDTPKIEAGSGEDDDEDDDEDEGDPVPQEISQGTVRAVLSYTEEKNEDGDTMHAPVVVAFANDKEIAKLTGEPGFGVPPVSVQIAELDPGNSQPEVVVSFYTGGAHCCSEHQRHHQQQGWYGLADRRCRRIRRRPGAGNRSQRRRPLRVQHAR